MGLKNMSAQSNYEREEDDICNQYERGEITNAEMWKALNEIRRSYRSAAKESAQEAYDRELGN